MIIELTAHHAAEAASSAERVDRLHAIVPRRPEDEMHYDDFVQDGPDCGSRVGRHRVAAHERAGTGRRPRLPERSSTG